MTPSSTNPHYDFEISRWIFLSSVTRPSILSTSSSTTYFFTRTLFFLRLSVIRPVLMASDKDIWQVVLTGSLPLCLSHQIFNSSPQKLCSILSNQLNAVSAHFSDQLVAALFAHGFISLLTGHSQASAPCLPANIIWRIVLPVSDSWCDVTIWTRWPEIAPVFFALDWKALRINGLILKAYYELKFSALISDYRSSFTDYHYLSEWRFTFPARSSGTHSLHHTLFYGNTTPHVDV